MGKWARMKTIKVKNQNKDSRNERVENAGDARAKTPKSRPAAGLMRKTRSNASWNGLSREQRGKLEEWLFEERLGFKAALERAKTELGYAGSQTSLRRFYERMKTERMLSSLTDTGRLAETVEKSE